MNYIVTYTYMHNLNIKELGNLIDEHSLFESSYSSSRYKKFIEFGKSATINNSSVPTFSYENDSIIVNKFSVVVASINNNNVGLLVLENYEHKNKKIFSFIYNKIKRSYKMIGFLGMYVKPDFRKIGIAKKMIEELNNNVYKHIDKNESYEHINLIAASSKAYDIGKKYIKDVHFTNSASNDLGWKNYVKSTFSSLKHIEKHYLIKNKTLVDFD